VGAKIDIWYGRRQAFGRVGNPQECVNILGNVACGGEGAVELSYRLNGKAGREADGVPGKLNVGPHPIERGPRRLYFAGDFNIDLNTSDLLDGENIVEIAAVTGDGERTHETVIVEYHLGNVWPLPYEIDWPSLSDASVALQISDGLWRWGPEGIRTAHVAYDRLLLVGDVSWRDYEATVPVTVHAVDESVVGTPISWGCNLTVFPRWRGHTDTPVCVSQPKCGWIPAGPMHGFFWQPDEGFVVGVNTAPDVGPRVRYKGIDLRIGGTYWFKMRVETADEGSVYRFKVWADGQPEPEGWPMRKDMPEGTPATGSLGLLAHHVDATFGNLSVIGP